MRRDLHARFWFEAITGVVGSILFVVTLFSREWFEELTGLDPDGGNGSLEIGLALGLLALSVSSILAARHDYRKASA